MLAYDRPIESGFRTLALAIVVLGGGWASAGLAQQPEQVPYQQTEQVPYQQTEQVPYQQVMPGTPPQSTKQSMRQLFAGTLATVLQGVGAVVSVGLTQSIAGALTSWFNRPGRNNQQLGQSLAAGSVPGIQPPVQQLPEQQPPLVAQQPQDFGQPQAAVDPATLQPVVSAASVDPAQQSFTPPPEQSLHAGIAFEVHLLGPAGSTAVDPSGHTFTTGERFVVHYRPTLPGQVIVFNRNPLGEERQIDQVDVAAGQLATLGPYEFRDNKGDETLRLVLMPCTTDALAAATRDIVKVDASPASAGLSLTNCNSPAPRGVEMQTRDIAKVEVEGQTAFALDPVSPQEVASGQFAAREVTLVFHHQ